MDTQRWAGGALAVGAVTDEDAPADGADEERAVGAVVDEDLAGDVEEVDVAAMQVTHGHRPAPELPAPTALSVPAVIARPGFGCTSRMLVLLVSTAAE